MRRYYYTTPRKQKLKQEALLHLRKLRRTIDPAVLDRARELIAAQAEEQQAAPASNGDTATFDRRKNLSIIMKFLELQTDRSVRMQVRSLLNEELS